MGGGGYSEGWRLLEGWGRWAMDNMVAEGPPRRLSKLLVVGGCEQAGP